MPATSHRQRQKAETRRLILETAYVLFEEKGYARSTMRELASRAGVALGTIFQHFADKPCLLVAAFQDDVNAVTCEAFATLPEANLRAKLLHLVRRLFGFYAARPALGRILIKEVLFLEGARGQVLEETVMAFLTQVGQLIHAGVERGELPANTNLEQAVRAFWSFYFLCLVTGLRAGPFDIDSQVEMMARLLDQHFFVGGRQ